MWGFTQLELAACSPQSLHMGWFELPQHGLRAMASGLWALYTATQGFTRKYAHQKSGNRIVSYDLALEFTQHHFHIVYWIG